MGWKYWGGGRITARDPHPETGVHPESQGYPAVKCHRDKAVGEEENLNASPPVNGSLSSFKK